MKRILTTLAIAYTLAMSAQAATLTLQNTVNFTNSSVLINAGTLVYAINAGAASGPSATVNGIAFVGNNTSLVAYTPSPASVSVFMTSTATTTLNDANFNTVLKAGVYDSPIASYITLKSLTIGQEYLVQLLTVDTRSASGKTIAWGDSTANAATAFAGATTYTFLNGSPYMGQSTVFSFTADATTQNIYYSASNGLALNAVILDAVPEPSTWALIACGLTAAAVIRRRQTA